jgi:hypothetical protein
MSNYEGTNIDVREVGVMDEDDEEPAGDERRWRSRAV